MRDLLRALRRLLPDGLRGQVAGILLLGLAMSQALAAIMYTVLLPQWQKTLRPELAVTKVVMVAKLLEAVPVEQRTAFAQLWSDEGFEVRHSPTLSAPRASDAPDDADSDLQARIAARLQRAPSAVSVRSANLRHDAEAKRIDVDLNRGDQVEVITPVGAESRLGRLEQLAIVAFLIFSTAGLWAWLTWTVNRPLTRFAHAAERVGLDVQAPGLQEQGPAQLKRAIRAFNEMQTRLQRFLSDRTRMLGAISHDLRTPLTRLRLRIETNRVAEESPKMLADIESMEAMLTSTLSFIRGVDDVEAAQVIDVNSTVQTVCDLVADLGGEVAYAGCDHYRYTCKPQAIMRALTNLVANAVKYGGQAEVSVEHIPSKGFLIVVKDPGPGIPDGEKLKVFEPFYRTAAAQETDSEGMGLGLAIARTIILAHGGSIELVDRHPTGLCARVFLPEASSGGNAAV